MKNIKCILMAVLAACFVTSCDWFVLDNQDSHDAQVYGTLIDAETGTPVYSEIYGSNTGGWGVNVSTGYIKVVELGWDSESFQTWYVKNNGNYRNDLVFSGHYRMDTNDANFYPVATDFQLKEGENHVDFTVTPYARFTAHTISYDTASKKIKASCTVELADPIKTTKINEIRLCCYTDNYVGSSLNNCKNDAGAVIKNVEFDKDGKATVELTIDTQDAANATEFKYEREHYVRLGVLATGDGVNTASRYNFTPTYRIKLDGSEPVLYNEW